MTQDRLIQIVRSVQSGVHWLKNAAGQNNEPRSTAIAISSLVAAERNPHSALIQRLVREASASQMPDGSWNAELWDTAWMTRALLDVGQGPNSPAVQKALRFLRATQDPIDGTWYEEPFETMLVLDLLVGIEPPGSPYVQPALDWLASLQRPDGLLVGTRYTGMAISLFQRLPVDDPRRSAVVSRGLEFLRKSLDARGIWTGASWSNFYALRALLDTGLDLDDPHVQKAVDWFLSNQEASGRWLQVSQIHDSAMAVMALSRLLTVPLIDLTVPSVAILQVNRENGTIRVGFVPPGLGAIVPSERMKLSDSVRAELGLKQQEMLAAIGRTRSAGSKVDVAPSDLPMTEGVLRKAGQYTYGHLIPPRIQALLEGSTADHLRMDVDERLIDLPWELIHDGSDFLCMRYAAGRRLVSDQLSAADGIRHPRPVRDASALVIADPTADLPGAKKEGEEVSALLKRAGLRVDFLTGRDVKKRDVLMSLRQYDIVHYAGHATHDSLNPDESCLVANDGEIQAFEIARFLKAPCPSVVFLNACWSAEELRDPEAYSPMMRGLSRTFMYAGVTAFLGYLVPVPDRSAKSFAIEFYTSISVGRSIGESVRRSRIAVRESYGDGDVTWASAVLYGEPSAGVLIH